MKLPRINNVGLNNAMSYTLRSSKNIVNNTRRCVKQIGSQSRKVVAATMIVSGSLNPTASKAAINLTSNMSGSGDAFIKSVSDVASDMVSSNKVAMNSEISSTATPVKKAAKPKMKTPVVKSAKEVRIMDNVHKSPQDMNVALNSLLVRKTAQANPLKNKAGLFITKANKYGVNPVVLMAISLAESARGTSSAAIKKNNVGGIMGQRGLRKFEKVEDCIEKMAETLSNHHNKSNIDTLEELGRSGKYCNKSASATWIKHVMFYVKKLSSSL